MILQFFDATRARSIADLTQPRGCRPGKNAPKRRDRRVSTAVAHTICETRGRSPAPPPASRRRAGATGQVPWHHRNAPCCRKPASARINLCLYARYAQPNQHMGASVWQRQRAGESERLVIERPWLQFPSEQSLAVLDAGERARNQRRHRSSPAQAHRASPTEVGHAFAGCIRGRAKKKHERLAPSG
eukprot:COSAG01_NODE_10290_length_2199_cov_2.613333_2_plen_187_part_00